MSGCAIAAIVVGLAGVLGLGTCVALVAIGASTEAERPARAKTARPVVPSAYEGAWSGGGITLVLSGGHADYKKKDGGTSVSVNGKYTLNGPDIEIDLFVTSKTIEVDDPPHEEGGVWKMTVEGVELTRSP